MNELDFDKLLSIEDPAPAKKPKLEPVLPVPPAPEPEEKPEEQLPRLRPRHIVAAIVLVALLIVGIGLGRWLKNIPITDNALPPARPITTVPPPSIPPSNETPLYVETRNSILLQENSLLRCYAYTERIDTAMLITFHEEESTNAIWDGTTLHIPQPIGLSYAPQYNLYNIWLRIELTESGKEQLSGSKPIPDSSIAGCYITPYSLPGSDEPAGWFILAQEEQTRTATLTFEGKDLAFPVTLQPLYDSVSLHFFTTEQLLNAIFADESLWNGGLPYPFSRNALLKELLNRVDSIQLLLQMLESADAVHAAKAAQLLEQKELRAKLTDEQLAQFQQLTGQYMQQQVYSYRLTITEYPKIGAVIFEDKDTYYIVAPEIPAEVASLPLKQVNCFIRIDLLEHTRQQYGDQLTLSLKIDTAMLGIRPYYDKDGLAGWFVYGQLESSQHIALALETASGKHLQTLLFEADPIGFFVPT